MDTIYFLFTSIIHDIFYYKENKKRKQNKLIGFNKISNQTDISEECTIFKCNHKFHLECSN